MASGWSGVVSQACGPLCGSLVGMRVGAEGTAGVLALDPRDRPLYTLREAARYLGVPEATLRTWVRGRSYPVHGGQGWSEPLITTPEGHSMLSFHNLVEANVLAALRKEHRITMGKVRQMVAYARERLGVAWTSRWAWGTFS